MVLKFQEFIKTFYRHAYVQQLNAYVSAGKQILWMDKTNFNLFIRRKTGNSRVGTRAVVMLPAARGPNVHLMSAMTSSQLFKSTRHRGSFTCETANEWVQEILNQ